MECQLIKVEKVVELVIHQFLTLNVIVDSSKNRQLMLISLGEIILGNKIYMVSNNHITDMQKKNCTFVIERSGSYLISLVTKLGVTSGGTTRLDTPSGTIGSIYYCPY